MYTCKWLEVELEGREGKLMVSSAGVGVLAVSVSAAVLLLVIVV